MFVNVARQVFDENVNFVGMYLVNFWRSSSKKVRLREQ
jgi:hypothetical protein